MGTLRKHTVVLALHICLAIFWPSDSEAYLVDDNPYHHVVTLDRDGKYTLDWLVNWQERTVTFNVSVETTGYVGFGLARKGKMTGADVVIGGVGKDGKPYFSDRHAVANQLPIEDTSQDWTLHSAREHGGRTYLSFSRPFDTCDSDHDLPITDDVINVIWAYSEVDSPFQYHFQHRGAYPVYLLDPDLTPRSIDQVYRKEHPEAMNMSVFTLTRTLRLPVQDTLYWCGIHKVPTQTKQHVIGFNTAFPTETDRTHVHHLLLHRCRAPPGVDPVSFFEGPSRTGGTECYILDRDNPLPTPYCRETIHVWGVGGKPIFFPDHAGLPMSEEPNEYFLYQVHYDNPNLLSNLTITVNLELFYTSQIRENEVGLLQLGDMQPGQTTIMIPPSSQNHIILGHCAPGCTERILPSEGINLFSVFLHTHISGSGVRALHIRGNQELPWIAFDDNYNFDYQQNRVFRQERKVLPGDLLMNRCTYDTTNRNGSVVVGGFSTRDEMCTAFFYYYARRAGFSLCRSEIQEREHWDLLGIRNVTWNQSLRNMVVTDPQQYRGLTVRDYANRHINWTIEMRNELQRDQLYMPQVTSCPRFYYDGETQPPPPTGYPGSDGRPYTSVDAPFQFESVNPRNIPRYRRPPQCTRNSRKYPDKKTNDL